MHIGWSVASREVTKEVISTRESFDGRKKMPVLGSRAVALRIVARRSSISGASMIVWLLNRTTANRVLYSDFCKALLMLLISVFSLLSLRLSLFGSDVKSKKARNKQGIWSWCLTIQDVVKTPSGYNGDSGDKGDRGECRTHCDEAVRSSPAVGSSL